MHTIYGVHFYNSSFKLAADFSFGKNRKEFPVRQNNCEHRQNKCELRQNNCEHRQIKVKPPN